MISKLRSGSTPVRCFGFPTCSENGTARMGRSARSTPLRRGLGIMQLGCVAVALLSACTPADKLAVRAISATSTLEVATCEEISVNVVRVEQFDTDSSEWAPAWVAIGDHSFVVGDQVVVGQPIEGMEVKLERPLDFSEDSTISVSLERWADSVLDNVDDTYQFDRQPLAGIGFTFEVSELGDQWRRADHTSHELPCTAD